MSRREHPKPPTKVRLPVGEVVDITVHPEADRPVRIECHDHAHYYEFAWRETEDGPVITDLRITSETGIPITKRTLARINADRLAVNAQSADTPEAAERGRALREVLESVAEQSGLPPEMFEWAESMRDPDGDMNAVLRAQGVEFEEDDRPTGRPKLPRSHYARVAELVLSPDGRKSRSVAEYVRKHMPYPDGKLPARETVYDWIKKCKSPEYGLLDVDAVRKSKTQRKQGYSTP